MIEAVSLTARFSKISEELVKVLKDAGFIKGYEVKEIEGKKNIIVNLKYENGKPAITEIKRVSKPGVRRYIKYTDIRPVVNGFGIMVLTTPKGVMSAKRARQEKTGGEILCLVW